MISREIPKLKPEAVTKTSPACLTYFPIAVDVDRFDARLDLSLLGVIVLFVCVLLKRNAIDVLAPSLAVTTIESIAIQ